MKKIKFEGVSDESGGVKVDFNGEVVCFAIPCEVEPGTKIRIIYEIETEN